MLIPRDNSKRGFIIEFKKVDKADHETSEMAAVSALKQIEDKQYATQLIDRGVTTIIKLAIVFDKKDALIRVG